MKQDNSASAADYMKEMVSEENMVVKENNEIVLVLMKSEEMDLVIEDIILGTELQRNPTIRVEDHSAFWQVMAEGRVEVDANEVSELLGRPYNVYDFLVNVSSTVGRAFTRDETFVITTELIGLDTVIADT